MGRSTIRQILKAVGLPPFPQRSTSCQTFFRARGASLPAPISSRLKCGRGEASFTYYTVLVVDLASRRMQIVGSTPHPEVLFMQQTVRTLTMADGGTVHTPHVLICDRDRKWSRHVRRRLGDAGVRVVLIPERSLNANA